MPELPEVETVCQGLREAMLGKRFTKVTLRRKDLRFPFPGKFATRLKGRTVESIVRRGKYIVLNLSGNLALLVHLGMTGRFTIFPFQFAAGKDGKGPLHRTAPAPILDKHDHVIFDLNDGTRILFNDSRRFGIMDTVKAINVNVHPLLSNLGIDPLSKDFHAGYLADLFKKRRTSIKAVLMDQKSIAGLGNIYVCEALFRAGLSPARLAYTLAASGKTHPKLVVLVKAIQEILAEAIAARGSTLRDYASTDGSVGNYQFQLSVYDRENSQCSRSGCRGKIRRSVQAGRSTYYCPKCQQ